MRPEDIKDYYMSGYNFRKQTGMSHNSMNNWMKCGYVPFLSQKKLEKLTDGRLIAIWDDAELEGKVANND